MGHRHNDGGEGKRAKVRTALLSLLFLAVVVTGLAAMLTVASSSR